jgi:hypothetical protein
MAGGCQQDMACHVDVSRIWHATWMSAGSGMPPGCRQDLACHLDVSRIWHATRTFNLGHECLQCKAETNAVPLQHAQSQGIHSSQHIIFISGVLFVNPQCA